MSKKINYDKMTLEEKVDAIISQIDEAFPYGTEQHAIFHTNINEEKKAEEAFIKDIKTTLAKSSIVGLLGILLTLIITGIYTKLAQVLTHGLP